MQLQIPEHPSEGQKVGAEWTNHGRTPFPPETIWYYAAEETRKPCLTRCSVPGGFLAAS